MLILGLGSNLGDRIQNLRRALFAIENISGITIKQVSPLYISDALLPENAPLDWDKPYLNLALRCETSLEPFSLLKELKNIEWSIGRKPEIRHWGPRVVDIDILAWDDLVIETDALTLPHASLTERPFALWPLADVAPFWLFPLRGAYQGKSAAEIALQWGSRFDGHAPFKTRQIYHRIDTPQLVGILNVTPDSFSDGGQFIHTEKAVAQAIHLVQSGAEIIDIGAESTAPNATLLTEDEEWKRLQPILSAINERKKDFVVTPKISVDTRHAFVAQKALDAGVDWINDVTGLEDPAMRDVVAQSHADCIVMHHVSIPASRDHVIARDKNVVAEIFSWGEKQLDLLEKTGIKRERIIFDPGIGFGKVPEHSLLLIKQIEHFTKLGTRILMGHSRKSFLSLFTAYPAAKRDVETLTIALDLMNKPVDYLRVHNVEMCARGFKVAKAL